MTLTLVTLQLSYLICWRRNERRFKMSELSRDVKQSSSLARQHVRWLARLSTRSSPG